MTVLSRPIVVATKYGQDMLDAARYAVERLVVIEQAFGIEVTGGKQSYSPIHVEMSLYNVAIQVLPKTGKPRARIASFAHALLHSDVEWTADRRRGTEALQAHLDTAIHIRVLAEELGIPTRFMTVDDGSPWKRPSIKAPTGSPDLSILNVALQRALRRQTLCVWLNKEDGNRKWPLRFGLHTSTEVNEMPLPGAIERLRICGLYADLLN